MKDKVKYILEVSVFEAEKFLDADYDIIGLKLNDNLKEVEAFSSHLDSYCKNVITSVDVLKKLLPLIKKPLMVRSSNEWLLLEALKVLDRQCIVGIANENNYKTLVPPVIDGGHTLIIRTPIDINLAKEMNILTYDMGLPLDKILIDTDIGGIGYGFEYGYSIMEKIKLENDRYLNMPLISFAAEETAKTKESRDKNMALYLEITAAAAVKAAGADYIVLNSPESIRTMRGLE